MKRVKEFIENLKPVDIKISEGVGRDKAVLYTIILLKNNDIEALYPEITVACCKLFPLFFSLKGNFQEYPDGRKVRDALWHIIDPKKAWVIGNTKSGYSPTKGGLEIYNKEIEPFIKGEIVSNKFYSAGSDKEEIFIQRCKYTDVFKKFFEGKKDEIKEYEIRYLLRGTRDTKIDILKKNLQKLLDYYNSRNFDDVKIDPKTRKVVLNKEEWITIGEMLTHIDKNFKKYFGV